MPTRRQLQKRIRKLSKRHKQNARRLRQLEFRIEPKFSFNPSRFTGTWFGPDVAVNRKGGVGTIKTIHLACDSNGIINGTTSWVANDGSNVGFDAINDEVSHDAEKVLGLVNTNTGVLHLVEKNENATFRGRVTEDNILLLEQTQPGEQPVVALMALNKVAIVPNVSGFDSLSSLETPPPLGFD